MKGPTSEVTSVIRPQTPVYRSRNGLKATPHLSRGWLWVTLRSASESHLASFRRPAFSPAGRGTSRRTNDSRFELAVDRAVSQICFHPSCNRHHH